MIDSNYNHVNLRLGIRHTILKRYYPVDNLKVKIFNYILEIDIFKNFSQYILGALKGDFKGLGVQRMPRGPANYAYAAALMM